MKGGPRHNRPKLLHLHRSPPNTCYARGNSGSSPLPFEICSHSTLWLVKVTMSSGLARAKTRVDRVIKSISCLQNSRAKSVRLASALPSLFCSNVVITCDYFSGSSGRRYSPSGLRLAQSMAEVSTSSDGCRMFTSSRLTKLSLQKREGYSCMHIIV